MGTLQDGGLSFNNPSPIAVQEVAALYPARPEPSTVVSVSTGSSETRGGSSFFHRVFQAFWRQADSTVAWKRLLSRTNVDSNTEYFRFDFKYDGKAPRLDDVDKMEAVGKAARQAVIGSPSMTELASHLRAQLFYFELEEDVMPLFQQGSFSCNGFISCRLETGTAAIDEFFAQLEAEGAVFDIQGRNLPIRKSNMTIYGGILRQKVHIRVSGRRDPFEILLREVPDQRRSISGSPFTLEWLIQQQTLDAVFGTEEHEQRKRKAHWKERQTRAKRHKS